MVKTGSQSEFEGYQFFLVVERGKGKEKEREMRRAVGKVCGQSGGSSGSGGRMMRSVTLSGVRVCSLARRFHMFESSVSGELHGRLSSPMFPIPAICLTTLHFILHKNNTTHFKGTTAPAADATT